MDLHHLDCTTLTMSVNNKQQGYECPKCKNNYSTAYSMYRHMRKVHNCDINRCVTLYCPIENCDQSYDRYNALDTHLTHAHYADIRKETFNFSDLQDFETWLRDITSSSKTKYIKRSCNHSYRYYRCHRSGLPKTSTDKINSMKSSVKIGRHCPSRIIAKITDRNVQVEFVPTHIGHECEIAKIPLSQKKRHDIACRLAISNSNNNNNGNNNNPVTSSLAAVAVQNEAQPQHPPTQQPNQTQTALTTPLNTTTETNQSTANATNNNTIAHQITDATQQLLGAANSVPGQSQQSAPSVQRTQSTTNTNVNVANGNTQAATSTNISNDNSLMLQLAPMKTTTTATGVPDAQQHQHLSLPIHHHQQQQQQQQQRQPQHIIQTANQMTQLSNMSLMSLTSPNRQELTSRFDQLMASIRSDKHASIVKAQLEVCFALIRD